MVHCGALLAKAKTKTKTKTQTNTKTKTNTKTNKNTKTNTLLVHCRSLFAGHQKIAALSSPGGRWRRHKNPTPDDLEFSQALFNAPIARSHPGQKIVANIFFKTRDKAPASLFWVEI